MLVYAEFHWGGVGIELLLGGVSIFGIFGNPDPGDNQAGLGVAVGVISTL